MTLASGNGHAAAPCPIDELRQMELAITEGPLPAPVPPDDIARLAAADPRLAEAIAAQDLRCHRHHPAGQCSTDRPCSECVNMRRYLQLLLHRERHGRIPQYDTGNGDGRQSERPADSAAPTCREIIRDYIRSHLRVVFRRAGEPWSDRLGAPIRKSAAMDLICTSELLERLAAASDAPRRRARGGDEVDPDRLPAAVRRWAPYAWGDLMAQLTDEASCDEVSELAADEFRRLVGAGLHRLVTMGHVETAGGSAGQAAEWQETRSLIEWAALHATRVTWQAARSYRIWSRRDEQGQIHVAVRGELYGQVGPVQLAALGHARWAELARRYGVGLPAADGQRVRDAGLGQVRAVELDPAWVAELLAPVTV